MGIITYQLLCGLTPFDGRNIEAINKNIRSKKLTFTEKEFKKVSKNAKDFIQICLDRDQNRRPTIEELFEHPWICEVPDSNSQHEEICINIQNNLIKYNECSAFQKMVLSLCAGLSTTQDQLEVLQKEFLRLDKDKNGTLCKSELEEMTSSRVTKNFDMDWDQIIEECDFNNDGVIDF